MQEENQELLDIYYNSPLELLVGEDSVHKSTGLSQKSFKDFSGKLEIYNSQEDLKNKK